jgi:hypothetical protein
MIRELLLVGRVSWPTNTPDLPGIDFSSPLDVKPIAWPETAGMSHRAYVLLLTSAEYQTLAAHKRVKGVTLHHAGTEANPIPTEEVLASVGLEMGEDNV